MTNLVHIPENVYAGQNTWGTYVGTQALSADHKQATIRVQTNVVNETTAPQAVTLTTQIVDADGNLVASDQKQATLAPGVVPSDQNPVFDETLTVTNPTLWYPNNSVDGKPYLYRVLHTVSIDGTVVDAKQSTLGIRTITWDKDFPYVNGKKQYMWGGSGRYDYPGLGSSVPEEQQWRDLKQMAAAGGNLWRPGHSPSSLEFVEAADALGVFIVQPSGDGENGFANACAAGDQACADMWTIKREVHREYLALVQGVPASRTGTIDAPIGRDTRDRTRMAIDGDAARDAVTHFEVVEYLGDATLLSVVLDTGRTHQIRVHLQAIGHPVLGDPTYGEGPFLGLERQWLHATRLRFPHPVTGEELEFHAPAPPELEAALTAARASAQVV